MGNTASRRPPKPSSLGSGPDNGGLTIARFKEEKAAGELAHPIVVRRCDQLNLGMFNKSLRRLRSHFSRGIR